MLTSLTKYHNNKRQIARLKCWWSVGLTTLTFNNPPDGFIKLRTIKKAFTEIEQCTQNLEPRKTPKLLDLGLGFFFVFFVFLFFCFFFCRTAPALLSPYFVILAAGTRI